MRVVTGEHRRRLAIGEARRRSRTVALIAVLILAAIPALAAVPLPRIVGPLRTTAD
jgi:hypothetical protein